LRAAGAPAAGSGSPDVSADAHAGGGAFALVLALVLAPWAWLVWRFDWVCDDAFISFRFARNLAEGHGLRYNLGPEAPIEGYSNFLWVLIAAVFERLALDVTVWMRVLSVASGALLIALVMRFARRALGLTLPETAATGLFLGTLPTIAVWSTSGLASMPACLFGFLTFERLLGDPERPRGLQAGACGAVLGLLRADGGVFVVLVLGIAGGTWLLARRPGLLRAVLVAGAVFALAVGAHAAWRYAYYGDAVPHTARVKAGFSAMRLERGWNYLMAYLLAVTSVPLVLFAAALAALPPRGRAHGRLALQAFAFFAATAAYAVYPGGDFMPFGRFFLPAMPFLALLFALLVKAAGAGSAPRIAALTLVPVALSLLPAFDRHAVPEAVRARFHFRWGEEDFRSEYDRWWTMERNGRQWSLVGRALGLYARPGETLLETRIGAIGYYSRIQVLDGFGLVNDVLATLDVAPRRTTPGHDRRIPIEYWLPFEPTFTQPAIKGRREVEAQQQELARTGRGFNLPWPGPVRLEVVSLPEYQGFRRGSFLTVYRYLKAE